MSNTLHVYWMTRKHRRFLPKEDEAINHDNRTLPQQCQIVTYWQIYPFCDLLEKIKSQ